MTFSSKEVMNYVSLMSYWGDILSEVAFLFSGLASLSYQYFYESFIRTGCSLSDQHILSPITMTFFGLNFEEFCQNSRSQF